MMGISLVVAWAIVAPEGQDEDGCRGQPCVSAARPSSTVSMLCSCRSSILGGIKFGIVTPTEAAVLAAVYALLSACSFIAS